MKPRVLLIAPVGEGVGGMVSQTNALLRELDRQNAVEVRVIDSAQRYRDLHDSRLLVRVWGGGWQTIAIASALVRSCKSFRPRAVSISSSASLGLLRDIVLVALARMMGLKSRVSFHFGRIPELAQQRNWEWYLLSWVVRLANEVTVLDCRSMAVLSAHFPNECVRQLPNALDFSWIDEIRSRSGLRQPARPVPLVVYVGVVMPTKGVVELVEASSAILDLDFQLTLVGPAPPAMREKLNDLAAKRNDGGWLTFAGALSRDEAVEHIAAADVLVLPSYTEGFPEAVLEAMACGVAIVATAVGAIPEMLIGRGGEPAGVTVPPRDIESLKEALEDLLRNPGKRRELGAAARAKSEANYQISDLARHWAELWAEESENVR